MFIIKRLGNLITEERITIGFCKQAIINASYRKTLRDNVLKVLNNIEEYAEKLRDMVLNETYEPSPYGFEIRLEHGKERRLQKPKFFPDQCIHHLLMLLIEDKMKKRIDPYAIASVPGKGQSLGLKKLKYWIQEQKRAKTKTKYCGKGDIRKCFDSIKPDVIMRFYERFIKDKKYLRLMAKVAYSCESLPLGNYCSAWTLNLMLKDLDEAIRKHKAVHHYLRYMDDFVFFCSNKRKAKTVWKVVKEELAKLGLELKSNYQLFSIDDRGLDIIGYRIFRNYTILRRRNYNKILKQLKQLKNKRIYSIKECQSLMSRLGQCRHCHSSYIWELAGRSVNIDMMKRIISESSRLYSYTMMGKPYTPKLILF